ncbi:MAG TPA: ABC transporter substrate-binding protein [Acidothermaceae bacterium]|nr:ABC transporter substrate-binding protein [Acidothermaceae bacterium]
MIFRHTVVRTSGLVVLAAFAVACTSSGKPAPTAPTPASTAPTGALASAAPTSATASQDLSRHVRVLGLWSGPEYDNFVSVKSAWEKNTDDTVDWQGTQDLPGALDADEQAGNPPDIAVLPNLAVMRQLAKAGRLVPLNSVLDMNQVNKDYAPAWIGLGSDNGKLYGIFYKVSNKATVWYSPSAFVAGGYTVPKTWNAMTALADKIVADGRTPFSVVSASGPASGWPLTDWVSEIVLNNCGPGVYDKWIAAEIPWTDACIKQSFEMFDKIVQTKGYALGGTQGILATADADGGTPLYTNPPTAYMYYLSSIAQGFIAAKYPNLNAGHDYNFFPFPSINAQYSGAVTIGADVVVMVHDTPAARSFMTYLAGAPAQEAWIKLGGFTSVNRSVPSDTYLDPVGQAVAAEVTNAKVVRFGAGDMMPASLQQAWWAGMLQLVKDSSQLDAILSSLTSAAKTAT